MRSAGIPKIFDTVHLYRLFLLGFLGAGLLLAYEGFQLRYYGRFGPGSGFFPVWLGIGMIAISLAGFIQSFRTPDTDRQPIIENSTSVWRVAAILLSLVILSVAISYAGFRLPVLIYMIILPRLVAPMPLRVILPVALLASFGVGYVFESLLLVRLPAPQLEFLASFGIF